MTLIKKIRNEFAHHLDVDTFETPIIKGWCFNLKHFQNFVYTDAELSGPGRPKKIFGSAGMDVQLQTAKGRYLVAIQVYSMIFGPDWPGAYLPPINLPAPLY